MCGTNVLSRRQTQERIVTRLLCAIQVLLLTYLLTYSVGHLTLRGHLPLPKNYNIMYTWLLDLTLILTLTFSHKNP